MANGGAGLIRINGAVVSLMYRDGSEMGSEQRDDIMKENLGAWDRGLRILVGLALLGAPLAWYGLEYVNPWGFIGLVPLFTGLYGACPLYSVLGISTACK